MTAPTMTGPLSRHAMAYVLAGGRGSRLMELTDIRAKPAVYFGGKSRIIDFALSNALNSGIRRIAVATQYKAHSLIRHLNRGWSFFRPERNESFDILPASQRVSADHVVSWARRMRCTQNIDIIESVRTRNGSSLLAGDHIYKMDYEQMLQQHVERCGGRDRSPVIEVPRAWRRVGFGVMHVGRGRAHPCWNSSKSPPTRPPMPGRPDMALASMGIYVFETKFLFEQLRERRRRPRKSSHDFGKDIIPYLVEARQSGGALFL